MTGMWFIIRLTTFISFHRNITTSKICEKSWYTQSALLVRWSLFAMWMWLNVKAISRTRRRFWSCAWTTTQYLRHLQNSLKVKALIPWLHLSGTNKWIEYDRIVYCSGDLPISWGGCFWAIQNLQKVPGKTIQKLKFWVCPSVSFPIVTPRIDTVFPGCYKWYPTSYVFFSGFQTFLSFFLGA